MTTIDIRAHDGARGRAIGLGISLLLHVVMLVWLRYSHAPRPDAIAEPPGMVFVLVPPQPLAQPRTVEAPPLQANAPAKRASSRTHAVPAAAAQRETSPASTMPVISSAVPVVVPTESAATSMPAASPAFDIMAAREAARLIAREEDKGLTGRPKRKPLTNLNAERRADAFERARRVDCQTARGGSTNLLANVVLLAKDIVANAVDDSGCKW
jgi:hypothetical protein